MVIPNWNSKHMVPYCFVSVHATDFKLWFSNIHFLMYEDNNNLNDSVVTCKALNYVD